MIYFNSIVKEYVILSHSFKFTTLVINFNRRVNPEDKEKKVEKESIKGWEKKIK